MRSTPYSGGPSTSTITTVFGYNADGQRVIKEVLGVQTCTGPNSCTTLGANGSAFFVYGLQGELLGEYSLSTGAALREYIWLQGIPLAVVVNDSANPPPSTAQTMHIHADHLNTPRVVLNRAGFMRWSWMAEPFGNNGESNNPQGLGAFSFNLRMPGQYFDAESGLNYNWHRDYDAGVGRYTQSDPIGLAGGINTYACVGSAPTMYVDPDGLNPALAVYRAGMTGYRIGEAINPYVQPAIASAVDALLLPDFNDPSIILAQNNKQIRKRIAGLQAHIDEHKKRLDKEPDCQASNHWRNEIAAAEAEIARLRLRLPNGR
jgi:RHS repeat-associated protein